MQQINPIFAVRGELGDHEHHSTWLPTSPWPEEEIAFNWTNFDYPQAHTHDYWELLILVSGSLRHEINGKTEMLRAQQACLLRPDDCHSLHAEGTGPVIVLNFMAKGEYIEKLLAVYGQQMQERVLQSGDLSFSIPEDIFQRCVTDTQVLQVDKNLSLEQSVSRCKILFVGLISELMMQNVTIAKPYPTWLAEFLVRISHSDLSDISIKKDLTEGSGYSYSRLIYLFKKYVGCTIAQYISHQRVERAKEYLKYTDMKMIEIAAAVGCDNVTHFNRIFKAATGMSPTQFRCEKFIKQRSGQP